MSQFWPYSEVVQRGSFTTTNPPTAIVFPRPFVGVPELNLLLVVTSADAFVMTVAVSTSGFTAGAVQRAASAWVAGYTIHWTARGRI